MKSIVIAAVLCIGAVSAFGAAQESASGNAPADEQTKSMAPQLPETNSKEYWVIRNQAMQEFIPFLTNKRAEIKTRQKMLADYLLQIGKGDEFAESNIQAAYDPQVYAQILRVGSGMQEMNVALPKERPTWDQLVEVAMQHVVYEGYVPVELEDEELEHFVTICEKKEDFGKKVRADGRKVMDNCARMWGYLEQIGKLGEFKAHEADIALQQEAQRAQEREAIMEQKKQAAFARSEDRKQQEYEEKMAREEFRSSRNQRYYQSRQDHLQYRQTQLDDRYTNSRAYYY